MALNYEWRCKNGVAKCYNTGNNEPVGNPGNCHAQTQPDCTVASGSKVKASTLQNLPTFKVKSKNFHNFVGSDAATPKSNGIYLASCAIGAFVGYKMRKSNPRNGMLIGIGFGLVGGTIINSLV